MPPICDLCLAGALLYSASADVIVLDCLQGQEQAFDPSTDAPLCVGIPCPAGSTGPAGECVLCPAGTCKPFAGPDACSPCPLKTFQPFPCQADLSDCAPCPVGAFSPPAATACVCNAGYAGNGSVCAPYAPPASPCASHAPQAPSRPCPKLSPAPSAQPAPTSPTPHPRPAFYAPQAAFSD